MEDGTTYGDFAVTGYGTAEGLCGINCRHFFWSFIEGVSEIPDYAKMGYPTDRAEIERIYKDTQTQRRLEREIRGIKREIIALEGAGEEIGAESVRLKGKESQLTRFLQDTGETRQRQRVLVAGFDDGTLKKKAAEAYNEEIKNRNISSEISQNDLKNNAKYDIINTGGENVSINSPIDQRNTGKGNPNAILHFDRPLNNRQQKLLDMLDSYDSRTTVNKKNVNMKDLSALTAATGDEFAMFTKNQERLIIRGDSRHVNVNEEIAANLNKQGYKWSGHTHPGNGANVKLPSDGDILILRQFDHENSVIYDWSGKYEKFDKH